MDSGYSDKVSWNIAQGFVIDLANTLALANKLYFRGEIKKWFFCLKSLKLRIIQSLKPDERKEFSNKEDKIRSISPLRDYDKLIKAIEDYNEYLMDKLNKYGYLMKPEMDSTKMFG